MYAHHAASQLPHAFCAVVRVYELFWSVLPYFPAVPTDEYRSMHTEYWVGSTYAITAFKEWLPWCPLGVIAAWVGELASTHALPPDCLASFSCCPRAFVALFVK